MVLLSSAMRSCSYNCGCLGPASREAAGCTRAALATGFLWGTRDWVLVYVGLLASRTVRDAIQVSVSGGNQITEKTQSDPTLI